MAYRLDGFAGIGLDDATLELLLEEHRRRRVPRLQMLWNYFRNPLEPVGPTPAFSGERPRLRAAQEAGLPARLTGSRDEDGVLVDPRTRPRREVVIENDIAWRIQTMVDFMFGKPVQVISTAADEGKRRRIERTLDAVWEASGGIGLLQDMALLGHVYGYVDLVLRLDETGLIRGGPRLASALASGSVDALAELIRIETVEPRRGVPVLNADDYRRIDALVIHLERGASKPRREPGRRDERVERLFGRKKWRRTDRDASDDTGEGQITEVLGRGLRQVHRAGELVIDESSALLPDVVPVVHIQNLSQPFAYEGLGEVEPLVALQDELNTRLSDRASRVTMQSFKMYLAKRLEGFENAGVGPGVIWATDDPDASVEAFGGDAASPSESEHIEQIREALDKASAVPPLAGGVVRAKIGNLSSANALRITLMSLLSKTARKRVTYGRGMTQMSRMVLTALDAAGVLRTDPSERGIRLVWPDPQPIDPADEVRAAQEKIEVGVPEDRVLAELGYAPTDPGVA